MLYWPWVHAIWMRSSPWGIDESTETIRILSTILLKIIAQAHLSFFLFVMNFAHLCKHFIHYLGREYEHTFS